ncbi:MAG: hypothetical protein IH947_15345, partial [Bacteroidetes bacterium]|nr:hypothetical protein [Bacteroidota bacterium]
MEYLSKNDDLAKAANYLNEGLRKSASQYYNDYLREICRYDREFISSINDLISRSFGELEKNLSEKDPADPSAYFTRVGYVIQAGKSENRKFVTKTHGDLLFQLRKVLSEFKETRLTVQKNLLKDGMEWLFTELKNIVEDGPEFITTFYETDELRALPGDSFALKTFKFRKRTWAKITGKPVAVNIPFRELQQFYLPSRIQIILYKLIKNYGKHSFENISGLQELFSFIKKSFHLIEEKLIRGEFSYEFLTAEKQKAEQLLSKKIIDRSEDYRKSIDTGFQKTIQLINDDLRRVDINVLMNRRRQIPKPAGKLKKKTDEIPGLWYKNQTLFFNAALMDLLLLSVQNRLGTIVQKVVSEIDQTVENKVLGNLKKQNECLTAFAEELKTDPSAEFKPVQANWENAMDALYYKEIIDKATGDIKDAVGMFPETIEIMGEARPKTGKKSLMNFENKQFDKIDIISISLNRLVDYLIQANLVEPLRQQLNEVPRKLRKTINIAEDVVRLITFSLNNPEPDLSGLSQTGSGVQRNNHNDVIEFINEGNVRIKDERTKTKELKKQFFSSVNDSLNITVETLQPDKIILSAGNLKHYIKKSKSTSWQTIAERVKMLKTHIRRRFTKIWYRRSEGVLAARKLSPRFRRGASWQKTGRDNDTQIDELLNILDAVSPNPQVLESLPFYYKQLFLGKQKVDKAFWRGRKKALA